MGIVKINYETSEDREQILKTNSDKRLIEEHNIFEGNFLIFDDLEQERYIKSLEVRPMEGYPNGQSNCSTHRC